jgi:hypothetical protein
MDDDQIQARIEELEAEERRLRADEAQHAAHRDQSDHDDGARIAADAERLAAIKVELDQLWDLLRQRRARARAGDDPDKAQMRDEGTVEGYLG